MPPSAILNHLQHQEYKPQPLFPHAHRRWYLHWKAVVVFTVQTLNRSTDANKQVVFAGTGVGVLTPPRKSGCDAYKQGFNPCHVEACRWPKRKTTLHQIYRPKEMAPDLAKENTRSPATHTTSSHQSHQDDSFLHRKHHPDPSSPKPDQVSLHSTTSLSGSQKSLGGPSRVSEDSWRV